MREKVLLQNLKELREDQLKKTVTVFVVDKKTKRTLKLTKDLVTKSLAKLGVNLLAVIAGFSHAFGRVL